MPAHITLSSNGRCMSTGAARLADINVSRLSFYAGFYAEEALAALPTRSRSYISTRRAASLIQPQVRPHFREHVSRSLRTIL